MKNKRVSVFISLFLLALLGCTQTKNDQKRAFEGDVEQSLMSVMSNAVPELLKRLHSHVIFRDGVLIILGEFDFSNILAFPTTPTWSATCGFGGLDILFEYGQGEDNLTAVKLTNTQLTNDQCLVMLPAVVSETKNLLAPYNESQRSLR
jgi:hypothetical protein